VELKMDNAQSIRIRPFLRWAGGKRQLLPLLHAALPLDFVLGESRFIEPFIGGGAFLFSLGNIPSIHKDPLPRKPLPLVASDMNGELIATYKAIRDNPSDVIKKLEVLSKADSAETFYAVRAQIIERTDHVGQAARFIYLNRTCFNGLYRVNRGGRFNVPYAHLKNPTILNKGLLEADSKWLESVKLVHQSFDRTMDEAKNGDVVYLDPPYVPLSKTSSFSMYAKGDFGLEEQKLLAKKISELSTRGVYVILSNSMTTQTEEIFENSITLYSTTARRSIAASSGSRGNVDEVIGLNFPMDETTNPSILKTLLKKLRP
jgi:DNA adenine methylase